MLCSSVDKLIASAGVSASVSQSSSLASQLDPGQGSLKWAIMVAASYHLVFIYFLKMILKKSMCV